MTIYEKALEYLQAGSVVGLGSGRASTEFIKRLGARCQAGFQVRGVPTSEDSARLARQLGISLLTLDECFAQSPTGKPIDVAVDGADEVDPHLNLIKGYGRALLREKVVAAAAKKLVVLVDRSKQVPFLGYKKKLPVEVAPFALPLCVRRLSELGMTAVLWRKDGLPARTDNGNYILDCMVEKIAQPEELEAAILAIPGVVDTGLFLGMADVVLVGDDQFEFQKECLRKGS